jgi:hypothetical protein
VQSITRNGMFFQGSPVSGSKQCLGRQNAGGRAPGDSFGADEFRHGLAIVIVHRLLPHHDFAINAVFAGQSSTRERQNGYRPVAIMPEPAFRHRCRPHTVSKSSWFLANYRQNKCVQLRALSAYDITAML